MELQDHIFYQAFLSKDPRFDGKFFIAVKTTGIYCRPICPARPNPKNVTFFNSTFAAEKSGYRACLRCRPECAPSSPLWLGKSAIVRRALKSLDAQDYFETSEEDFAQKFGVTARHLRRLFQEDLGHTPRQIAESYRLGFAKKLIVETALPFTDIAYSSGFTSIRRFNDAVVKKFSRAPRDIRKKKLRHESGLTLELSYRPPLDWAWLLGFFRSHATLGVEKITENAYARVFELHGKIGSISIEHDEKKACLKAKISYPDSRGIFMIVKKIRRLFDLDADPLFISHALCKEKALSKIFQKHLGLRIPGSWDPYEITVTTILGQLVSVKQAQRLVANLVRTYGQEVRHPETDEIFYLFPKPSMLINAPIESIGTTKQRAESIRIISRLMERDESPLSPSKLLAVPGIGPWTVDYIGLRSMEDSDAFPMTDLILKRALLKYPKARLEKLSPWKGYAAMALWKHHQGEKS